MEDLLLLLGLLVLGVNANEYILAFLPIHNILSLCEVENYVQISRTLATKMDSALILKILRIYVVNVIRNLNQSQLF